MKAYVGKRRVVFSKSVLTHQPIVSYDLSWLFSTTRHPSCPPRLVLFDLSSIYPSCDAFPILNIPTKAPTSLSIQLLALELHKALLFHTSAPFPLDDFRFRLTSVTFLMLSAVIPRCFVFLACTDASRIKLSRKYSVS